MKYLIFCVAALSSLAFGDETKSPAEICKTFYDLGETIMKARQDNLPMPKLIEIYQFDTDGASNAARQLITAAYQRPRFSTGAHQDSAVIDFANDTYLSCLQKLSK